jgi:hypothetical protein
VLVCVCLVHISILHWSVCSGSIYSYFVYFFSEQMSGVAVVNEREIQPMNLSLDQLSQLKTQHEDELQVCLRFGASPLVRHSIIY